MNENVNESLESDNMSITILHHEMQVRLGRQKTIIIFTTNKAQLQSPPWPWRTPTTVRVAACLRGRGGLGEWNKYKDIDKQNLSWVFVYIP